MTSIHKNDVSIRIKRILLTLTICFSIAFTTNATETDMETADEQTLFSLTFFKDLAAAREATDPINQLEKLHSVVKHNSELAEVELTIARFYGQRTGFVDPAKSLEWYNKALVRGLPAIALVKQYILRGNTHEQLGHRNEALTDYVRGLLICFQYNLPSKWPSREGTGQLKPPPINSGMDYTEKPNAAEKLATEQQYQDFRCDYETTKREQDILRYRFYYVDAIKRVVKDEKMSEKELQAITEGLTNRQDRIDDLLHLVHGSNVQPWP